MTERASAAGPQRSRRAATLTASGGVCEVAILALSRQGALAEAVTSLRVGDRAALALDGGAPVATIVRWVRDGRFGLQFATPIPAALLHRPAAALA